MIIFLKYEMLENPIINEAEMCEVLLFHVPYCHHMEHFSLITAGICSSIFVVGNDDEIFFHKQIIWLFRLMVLYMDTTPLESFLVEQHVIDREAEDNSMIPKKGKGFIQFLLE